jgi:hypothetical protein
MSDASPANSLFGKHDLECHRVDATMLGGTVAVTLSSPFVINVTSAVASSLQ